MPMVLFAAAWVNTVGLPIPAALRVHSAPVQASFSYCSIGGGTNCVVDGDTFWIGGEKVRIAGIDAPETHPPRCDDEARLGEQRRTAARRCSNSAAR